MNYDRTIPRDLFNEAKLLKGLGFLILHIHDGVSPDGLTFEQPPPESEFDIRHDRAYGDLFVFNVRVQLHGESLYLFHPYNENEGLTLSYRHNGESGYVFEDPETFTDSFISLCQDTQ